MNESKAARYQRRHRQTVVSAWAVATIALAGVALTPIGSILDVMARAVTTAGAADVRPMATSVVFMSLVAIVCGLPPVIVVAAAPGAVAVKRTGVWRLRLLASAAFVVAVVVCGLVVQAAATLVGQAWWLLATVLLSAVLAAALGVGPRLLTAGGAVRPVNRPALTAALSGLSARAGVAVPVIGAWRSSEPGSTVAMVAGAGRRRQILLAADVAEDWSDAEVEAVVAHELAHLVHGDIWRSFALNVGVLACGLLAGDIMLRTLGERLAVAGAADPLALPLIALSALGVWLLATPVRHAQSRKQERRADRFALTLTGHAEAFAAAIRRAGARRLIDDRPSPMTRWLFHRHPPMAERLALAERFRQPGATGE